jgi:hypothetical protein
MEQNTEPEYKIPADSDASVSNSGCKKLKCFVIDFALNITSWIIAGCQIIHEKIKK